MSKSKLLSKYRKNPKNISNTPKLIKNFVYGYNLRYIEYICLDAYSIEIKTHWNNQSRYPTKYFKGTVGYNEFAAFLKTQKWHTDDTNE